MNYLSADDLIVEIEIVEIVCDYGETLTEFQPNEFVEDVTEILPIEFVEDEPLSEKAVEITKRKLSSVDEGTSKRSKITCLSSSKLQKPPAKTIYDLPVEILLTIFDFLPLKDRKNIRLTCELLFSVCSKYELQEKICIDLLYNSVLHSDVFEMLTKSKRQSFHLEFYGSELMLLSGPIFSPSFNNSLFWEICGEMILTLKLSYCKLSKPVLLNILKYCTSIKILELRFNSIYHDVERALSGLRCDNIRNQSIKELKIYITVDFDVDSNRFFLLRIINQILHSCPNILKFSLCHQGIVEKPWFRSIQDEFNLLPVSNHQLLSSAEKTEILSSFCQLLVNRQMESFVQSYWIHSGLEWNMLTSFEGLSNITEITIDLGITIQESFKKFLLAQVHLKSITCIHLIGMDQHSRMDKMVKAVLQVPSLHTFQLIYRHIIVWQSDWSTLLSASNIKTLRIACRKITFPSHTHPSNPKMLHFAVLVQYENNFPHVQSLLETFPNLEELYLSHVNHSLLEAICSTKINLQSLHAKSFCGFHGSLHLLPQLRFLRRLEIPFTLPPSSFNCLHFLKHLHIISDDDSNFDLKYLEQYSSPLLETVRIDCQGTSQAKKKFIKCVDQLVIKLKHLKFLSFSNLFKLRDLTVSDVSKIFDHCPSLQTLLVYKVVFYRNVFRRCISAVEKKTPWDQKFDTYELVAKYMNSEIERHPWDYLFHRSNVPMNYF